ncbi:MAG: DNA topoisomerase IV subunit A, partial [Lacticaseibacillus rhamnosus]|nr:DNA topoisomerase IV subunit A [Lacticaseibacillus rhamnosus]
MANQIQELTLEEVMGDRFGRYSKYIIQERALPDVRDGLKPVQRRILFAMNQDGNTYDKGFRKSAKSVGNVMGNYHPHGDSSIYEAMVRLSQDWKLRAPLIQMHGNNGSMDGDPPAAMRYTEARLSKISKEMLADIDKETVDMVLNFDDTAQEPTVLPAGFPNLLVNGATGISAGYATEIPPHNLREVVNAILYLLKHPQADLADLMQYVKGPDFPTGGIIQGLDGIKQAYETGRGKIVVRSRTHIETIRGGREKIVVTEIPYDVNKAQMIKKIDELRLNKKVDGIAEVRDESDRFGLSVVIELKKEADAHGILNYLFKNTDLQITYNFNMVAIADMQPKLLGLKAMLEAYVAHRRDVVTRRTRYELNKAQARQHIVEGLIKMLSILDQVIAAIRASSDKGDAKRNLVKQFDFSEAQAEAIVSLQLYRLTNTDITALQDEAAQLAKAIAEYQDILAQPASRDRVIEKELKRIAKEYGDDRRSSIQAEIETLEVATTVTVADETVMVQVSRDGYVKRSSLRSYQAVDPEDNGLKPNDLAIFTGELSTLQHLYIVTNAGNIIY